jgi:translation elongation factor P/translation initiation factor 5A
MDNPETTQMALKNKQSRDNRNGIQEWTIQRQQKWHSRMDNPETTQMALKNRQSRDNRNGIKEWEIQRKQKWH